VWSVNFYRAASVRIAVEYLQFSEDISGQVNLVAEVANDTTTAVESRGVGGSVIATGPPVFDMLSNNELGVLHAFGTENRMSNLVNHRMEAKVVSNSRSNHVQWGNAPSIVEEGFLDEYEPTESKLTQLVEMLEVIFGGARNHHIINVVTRKRRIDRCELWVLTLWAT
jgi:hypothetical protein